MHKFQITSDTVLLTLEDDVAPHLDVDILALSGVQIGHIERIIAAAQRWAEGYLGIAVGQKEITAFFQDFNPAGEYILPIGNIKTVPGEILEYYNTSGILTSLSGLGKWFVAGGDRYWAYPLAGSIEYPELFQYGRDRVLVKYSAGEELISNVDPRITQAMLLKIKHWYVNRADSALTTDDSPDLRTATELLDQVLREIQS